MYYALLPKMKEPHATELVQRFGQLVAEQPHCCEILMSLARPRRATCQARRYKGGADAQRAKPLAITHVTISDSSGRRTMGSDNPSGSVAWSSRSSRRGPSSAASSRGRRGSRVPGHSTWERVLDADVGGHLERRGTPPEIEPRTLPEVLLRTSGPRARTAASGMTAR